MNRRDLLAASLAASAAAAALPGVAADRAGGEAGQPGREFYELRLYRLRRGPMQKRADDYFRDALVPALRRRGTGPVGVFNVVVGPGNPTAYVLIPHPTAESFATLGARLAADAEYQKAGEPFLAAPAADPPYVGVESSLMLAAAQMPRIRLPPGVDDAAAAAAAAAGAKQEKPARVFELRTYRSHGERAGLKKIEMFESGGEIAIFRRVGLRPVFFAQNLLGPDLPGLTYLLTFPDLATREKNWNTFRADPEWKTLSTTPGYTDAEIVSSINSAILGPAAYSQI